MSTSVTPVPPTPVGPARKIAASVLLAVVPVAALLSALGWRDRLPDPLPRHWNGSGAVDGVSSFSTFVPMLVGALVVLAVIGLGLVWLARDRHVAGFSVALTGGLVWFLGSVFGATLVSSLDVSRAEEVSLPWVGMLLGAVVALGVAWLLHRLVPSEPYENEADRRPDGGLRLGADERITWIGGARATALTWIGGALVTAGAIALVVEVVAGVVLLVAGVTMLWVHRIRVRIDERGIAVGWGPGGWPTSRTALADITGVGVTQARPGEWGGWGYRLSPRGSAVLVRSGEALLVRRAGKKDLLITVDGAEQACEVLHALLQRRDA